MYEGIVTSAAYASPLVLLVAIVGTYDPLPFKFGGAAHGVKPADLARE